MTATLVTAGEKFEIPDAEAKGFIEGHVCTAAEAKTLFQTYKENVGNSWRKRVQEAQAKGEKLDDIAARIAASATAYNFAMPSQGGGRTVRDPVEREAINLAKKAISGHLLKEGKGRKLKDVENLDDVIAQVIEKNDLLTAAKRIVTAQQKAGQTALENVNLG